MTRYILAALALALALSGVQTWRLDRVKADLVKAQIDIATLTEFKALALDDAQTQADLCQARVEAARASARRIQTLVERPHAVDPSGCPVRDVLDADSLRDALQPSAPSP
jgi:hypothetical protein